MADFIAVAQAVRDAIADRIVAGPMDEGRIAASVARDGGFSLSDARAALAAMVRSGAVRRRYDGQVSLPTAASPDRAA